MEIKSAERADHPPLPSLLARQEPTWLSHQPTRLDDPPFVILFVHVDNLKYTQGVAARPRSNRVIFLALRPLRDED